MKNRIGNCQHGLSLNYKNQDCCLVCVSPSESAEVDIDEIELERRLTKAMRDADKSFEKEGGSTRHYVRYCLIPSLHKHGLIVKLKGI